MALARTNHVIRQVVRGAGRSMEMLVSSQSIRSETRDASWCDLFPPAVRRTWPSREQIMLSDKLCEVQGDQWRCWCPASLSPDDRRISCVELLDLPRRHTRSIL